MNNGEPQKSEEQYPLLTVDSGGGDNVARSQPTVVSVTCTPKQTWVKHWPEFMSACWTTLILLGITLLVFSALSMTACRQQSCIIKCNITKPAREVFNYRIVRVGEGGVVSDINTEREFDLNIFSVAFLYPCLKFNVIYLIDDSFLNVFRGFGHSKIYNKLLPSNVNGIVTKVEEIINRERKTSNTGLQLNVHTRVEYLSKYMAKTPYKQMWRSVPVSYLPFYASAHAVYVHSGISVDMDAFNEKCFRNPPCSCKIMAIMRQHSDDIDITEYRGLSRSVSDEDAFIATFHGIFNIFTDLFPLFNRNMSFQSVFTTRNQSPNTPLVRTQRSKREVSDNTIINENVSVSTSKITNDIKTKESKNTKNIDSNYNRTVENSGVIITNETTLLQSNNTENASSVEVPSATKAEKMNVFEQSVIPIIHVYDFMAPWIEFSETLDATDIDSFSESRHTSSGKKTKAILAVDPEGSFIAAPRKRHPFLQDIINAGQMRMNPKYAIDRLRKQCSSSFRDEMLCNDFYVFYD